MTDITAASPAAGFSPGKAFGIVKRSELGLAIAIMAILVVLILPLPTWVLDVCLAFSLSFAILILMTAVFIRKPLEFSPSQPSCSSPPCCGWRSTSPRPG